MSKQFKSVSLEEFTRMTREQREQYIDALIEHLPALRAVPPANKDAPPPKKKAG